MEFKKPNKTYKFHIITFVWGKPFIKMFYDVVVPSLLSKNNIPLFKYRDETILRIYTTPDNVEDIVNANEFKKLNDIIDIELNDDIANNFGKTNSYIRVIYCCRDANREAYDDNAIIIFLYGDSFVCDGAFDTIEKIYDEGKDGIIVNSNTHFNSSLTQELIKKKIDGIISLNPREALSIAKNYYHIRTKYCNWLNTNNWPMTHINWVVDDNTLLMKSFRLQPIMMRSIKDDLPLMTPDKEVFLETVFKNLNNVHYISDSDELLILSLDDEKYCYKGNPNYVDDRTVRRIKISKMSAWKREAGFRYAKRFIKYNYIVHSDDIDQEKLNDVIQTSEDIVEKIIR